MLTFKDEELRVRLQEKTGTATVAWIPEHISVRGFVYDVKTGRLHEVALEAARRAG